MKKIKLLFLTVALATIFVNSAKAQTYGMCWNKAGNTVYAGQFLGSNNKIGFGIRAYGQQVMYFDTANNIKFDTISFYVNGFKFLHNAGSGGGGGVYRDNTFLGYKSGQNFSGNGYANTGIGKGTLENLTGNYPNSTSDIAIGYNAMNQSVTSDHCTVVGVAAMELSTRGTGITAVGHHSAGNNRGNNSTYLGRSAGEFSRGASEVVAIGYYNSQFDTANYNVNVGALGNYSNVSSTKRTGIGWSNLTNNTGEENTVSGYLAMGSGTGAGSYNTAGGVQSLTAVTSGNSNTAYGRKSGLSLTTGGNNIFVGKNSAELMTTGSRNLIIGVDILTVPSGATASNQMNIAHAIYGYGTMSDSTSAYLGFGGNPVNSAKVAIKSTTQGFLPPVMTATQGSAISSPAEGLMIYVTNTNGTFTSKGWWGWNGSAWEKLNN